MFGSTYIMIVLLYDFFFFSPRQDSSIIPWKNLQKSFNVKEPASIQVLGYLLSWQTS